MIPAAGESRRMGHPKLLLPWRDSTVLQCVLAVWKASDVCATVLVVRPEDTQLAEIGRHMDVDVVVPEVAPSEMKLSVQVALDYIGRRYRPVDADTWLLCPADVPNVTQQTIRKVLTLRADSAADIVVPVFGGCRGHPVAFSWRLARDVEHFGAAEGVNALLNRHVVTCCEINDPAILEDLDTPEDYERLK